MQKPIILPVAAAAAGVIGLIARRLYLAAALEPGTGLPVPGSAAGYAMWAVLVLMLVVCAALGLKNAPAGQYDYTQAFAPDQIGLMGGLCAAILYGIGGLFNLWGVINMRTVYGTPALSIIHVLLGVVCLLAAAGIFLVLSRMRRGGAVTSAWALAPGFASCLWVMGNYQDWAKNPVPGQYVACLAAILLTMAACCLQSGFAFGQGRPGLTMAVTLCSAAFAIAALGEGAAIYDFILYAAAAVYMLAMAHNLAGAEGRPAVSSENYDADNPAEEEA